MPVPFFTILKLKMTSGERSVSSEAQRGFCPSWTWCSFKVKAGCFERPLPYLLRALFYSIFAFYSFVLSLWPTICSPYSGLLRPHLVRREKHETHQHGLGRE